jgi:ornithine cyclodeaminase/alanine dehydrogenase-like protein (mu-crystallin family)
MRRKNMAEDQSVKILFLNKEDVDSLLDYGEVVDIVEDVFRADGAGELILGEDGHAKFGDNGGMLSMTGCIPKIGAGGVKWLGYFDRSRDAAYPTSWGNILILNHSETGLPFAILECTNITSYRTAGGHAVVGAKALARKNAKKLGVVGAGAQGRAGILSFDRAFDLETILLYSKPEAQRDALRDELAPLLRAEIRTVDSAEELTRSSDILLTASGAKDPVVREEWIPKGATVSAVSAFGDLDAAFSKTADKWFIGQNPADIAHIVKSSRFAGKLDENDVKGSLSDLLTGRIKGRESEEERILFSHMGMAVLDIAVGKHLYDKALKKGMGLELALIGNQGTGTE